MVWVQRALAALVSLTLVADALKIGFLGDSGAQTSSSRTGYFAAAVYSMMRSRNVDLVLQNGDFDYQGSPSTWDNFLSNHANGLDLLFSSGNHESAQDGMRWFGSTGYKARLEATHQTTALSNKCSGAYGERYECKYGANDEHHIVMIGWEEQDGSGPVATSASYIRAQFAAHQAVQFRHCMFHKPEGRFNNGEKHTSNYGLEPICSACRADGAVTTSGHSHVYGRTKVLTTFNGNNPAVSSSDSGSNPVLKCGETMAFIVGSSGFKHDDDGPYVSKSYWRKSATRTDIGADRAGALMCDYSGNTASCEYRLAVVNTVLDSFTVTSNLAGCSTGVPTGGGGTPTSAPSPPPVATDFVVDSVGHSEENDVGVSYVTSSDLEFGYDVKNGNSNQLVCMRFAGVGIPVGATVASAKLLLTCKDPSSMAVQLSCYADSAVDSPPITSGNRDLSDRTPTAKTKSWSPGAWAAGDPYRSPNLNEVVQEVVSKGGWRSGNALTICCSKAANDNSQTWRRAFSSLDPTRKPKLEISLGGDPDAGDPDENGTTEGLKTMDLVVYGASAVAVLASLVALNTVRQNRARARQQQHGPNPKQVAAFRV